MTSLVFLIETIYGKIFRCNYLRNKEIFPEFFLHFRNLDCILNIFKKTMTLIAYVFSNLRIPKNFVREIYKKSRFRGPFHK